MKNGEVQIENLELRNVNKDLACNTAFILLTVTVLGKNIVNIMHGFSWYLAVVIPLLMFCLYKFYQINKILRERKQNMK